MTIRFNRRSSLRSVVRRRGRGLVNTLINKLPIELHLPGYRFCGPGTRLEKRLARGDQGINPLDNACKEHDIAYSRTDDLTERHRADRTLGEKAWERFRAKDSRFGEKTAALTVAGIMKGKRKLGMGSISHSKAKRRRTRGRRSKRRGGAISFTKGIQIARHSLRGKKFGGSLEPAIKTALSALARKSILPPKRRVLPLPKTGGFIPLIPLFAALGALGSLGGGAAAIAKAVKDSKIASQTLDETKRHHKAIEVGKKGDGVFLRPYKQGFGLYLKSSPKN